MHAKSALLLCLLAIFGACCESQIISNGDCPKNVSVKDNLDLKKFAGVWYEFAKYPASFEINGKCIQAKYTHISEHVMRVSNSMIDKSRGKETQYVVLADVISSGKWNLLLPNSIYGPHKSDYWILDTDYSNYAVIYSCENLDYGKHATLAWILTRQRHPDHNTAQNAQNVFFKNKVSTAELQVTRQAGC